MKDDETVGSVEEDGDSESPRWIKCEWVIFREVMFVWFTVEDGAVRGFALEHATAGLPPPRPTIAQPTSTPDFIDHSQTNTKTGVLTRTFKTGKRSGYRAGG